MTDYQSDRTIRQLERLAKVQSDTAFPVMQGNQTLQASANKIAAYIAQGVPVPPALPPFTILTRSTDYDMPSGGEYLPWETAAGTDLTPWDPASPTKYVVPDSVNYIRLSCGIQWNNINRSGSLGIAVRVNNAVHPAMPETYLRYGSTGYSPNIAHLTTSVVPVQPQDQLEVRVYSSNTSVRKVEAAAATFLTVEQLS